MARQPSWLLLAMLALAWPSVGNAQNLEKTLRQLNGVEADTQLLRQSPLRKSQLQSRTHVAERLTDGELFYRLKDYIRASIIFTDIVDNYPKHQMVPDALFMLGDSLFRAGDYLGARTRLRELLARAEEAHFRPFVQRALGRLIEVAIHIRDFSGVDEYFAQLAKLPPSEVEAATAYYRAKYLYNVAVPAEEDADEGAVIDQEKLESSRVAFEAVSARSPYYSQARYFIGVIYTLRSQFNEAIESFNRACKAKASTPQQREVQELGLLALGRLYYEVERLPEAVASYERLPRASSHFHMALYEVAWTYIRMGDPSRAERALEVLSIAYPDSPYLPDAKLLRGNLLLRGGNFAEASSVFAEIEGEFRPVRDEFDTLLASHEDPREYFRQLVRDNIESFDANAFLPPLAVRWASTEGSMGRALSALGDLSQARQLVRETGEIVLRLDGALSASNQVNLFGDLRRQRERTTALRNRLARVRKQLMVLDEGAAAELGSQELFAIRTRRRELERRLGGMPTKDRDFSARDLRGTRRFRELQKQLSEIDVQLMGLDAKAVAIDRYMSDTMGDQQQEASVQAMKTELYAQRDLVRGFRATVRQLKLDIESGKLRVGIDDVGYSADKQLRRDHAALVTKERELIASLGGRSAPGVDAAFLRATRVEDTLDGHDVAVDAAVKERVDHIQSVLGEERVKLDGYRAQMAALDLETEVVVGAIAHANYKVVQARFYDLVLKADVGIIDVSWAEREEHRTRVEVLTRDRNRVIQVLEDEYREIMDEKGGP